MLASPLRVGTRTNIFEKSFVTMEMVDKNRIRLMYNAILVNGKPDSPNRASKHRKARSMMMQVVGIFELRNFDLRPER